MASAEGAGRSLTGSATVQILCLSDALKPHVEFTLAWHCLFKLVADHSIFFFFFFLFLCVFYFYFFFFFFFTVSYKEELHLEDEWYKLWSPVLQLILNPLMIFLISFLYHPSPLASTSAGPGCFPG